jgi:hypothetical protein
MSAMKPKLAFLIGAGASKGAGGIEPYDPPLGAELYTDLVDRYPSTWGTLAADVDMMFRENFEIGMAHLWTSELPGTDQLLIEMAIYFSQFEPPVDGSDCYSRLIWLLKQQDLIPNIAFASLNYECCLDVAANRLGFRLTHLSEATLPSNVVIWKPHGACNLLPQAEVYDIKFIAGERVPGYYEGPLRAVDPAQVRHIYARRYSLPPAMSLFAPGKPTPVAKRSVSETRRHWTDWVESADIVIIIGARPLFADTHIWDPIIASGAEIWYIGGASDESYSELKSRVHHRLIHIADRFIQGFGPLARRLRAL